MRFRVSSFTCVLEASSQELFSWCFDGAFFFSFRCYRNYMKVRKGILYSFFLCECCLCSVLVFVCFC